jgi:hypothetical protein
MDASPHDTVATRYYAFMQACDAVRAANERANELAQAHREAPVPEKRAAFARYLEARHHAEDLTEEADRMEAYYYAR